MQTHLRGGFKSSTDDLAIGWHEELVIYRIGRIDDSRDFWILATLICVFQSVRTIHRIPRLFGLSSVAIGVT